MKRLAFLSAWSLVLGFVALLLASCDLFGGGKDDGPRLEGIPGKIVYSAPVAFGGGGETHLQIFVTDREGTRQLTSSDNAYEHAVDPAWSPDGERIVFGWYRGHGTEELYVMNADGSGKRPLLEDPPVGTALFGTEPVWSPSGDRVAYQRCITCNLGGKNTQIFVVDLRSGTVETLTEPSVDSAYPTWSPDGEQIAFISNRDYIDADSARYRTDLYVMNADGSNVQRLTSSGRVGISCWNKSGNRILYAYQRTTAQLFFFDMVEEESVEVKTDLTGEIKLLPFACSSDGSRLLLTAGDYPNLQLYILDLRTGKTKEVSIEPGGSVGATGDWFVPN